jgi:hypothetical protein
MLPTFIHIGAPKAASTWLLSAWREHPDVYAPPDLSNIDFFQSTYFKGLDWYEKMYFHTWSGERALGHKGNGYLYSELALERIARDLPEVKLQVTLRDPIERTFIQWAHEKQGNIFTPIEESLSMSLMGTGTWMLFRMWIETSLYAYHLKRVYRHFPQDRVRVMFYEDLIEDPIDFLKKQFEWLEVDPEFESSTTHTLVGFPSPERPDTLAGDIQKGLPAEVRKKLIPAFEEDIDELQEMTGRDLSRWKQV